MRFKIFRTSDPANCPCREAVYDREKHCYFIEFNTLEELMAFVEKYNQIVIEPKKWHRNEYNEIEIYDDYRE